MVAVGCKDGTIKLWNAQTGKERCTTFGRHEGGVEWVAFSPDGRWLYSAGSKDKQTFVMDTTQDLSKKDTYLTVTFAAEELAHVIAPDETTWVQFGRGTDTELVEIDYAAVLKGNQAQLARKLADCKGHQGRVRTACFSLNSQIVATGGDDKTVRVWDRDGKELATLEGHTEAVVLVTVGHDGKVVASVSKGGTAKLWDVASKKELPALKLQKGVRCAAFSADSKFLATGGDDGIAKVWNVATGEEHATLKGHKGAIRSLTFSSDNNTLASGSQDKTAKLWQVEQ